MDQRSWRMMIVTTIHVSYQFEIFFQFSLSIQPSDKRTGGCYMTVPILGRQNQRCSDEIAEDVLRATCCCTVGRGWGEVQGFCDPCPRNDTGES